MKIVKPFIEKPFIPTEVDSIIDKKQKKRFIGSSMTSALLVGPRQRSNGEVDEVLTNEIIKKNYKL